MDPNIAKQLHELAFALGTGLGHISSALVIAAVLKALFNK